MEPFPKRFRSEFDGSRSRELLQGEAAVEHQRRLVQEWGAPHLASGRGGDQECRRFNTPEGCPYGSFCRFRHVPSGSFPLLQAAAADRRLHELGALKLAGWRGGDHECRHFNTPEGCPYGLACHFWHVPKEGRDAAQPGLSFGGKKKPCMKFFSTSGCPFGDSCHFLHYVPGGLSSVLSFTAAASQRNPVVPSGDLSTTINDSKTRLCNRFNTPEGCRFGDRCHFAHGEKDLRPTSYVPIGNWEPMGDGPMGPAPPNFMNANGNFSSPSYYPAPPGSEPRLSFQGYAGHYTPPGSAGATPVSDPTYQAGPVGGNAEAYWDTHDDLHPQMGIHK